MKIIFFFIVITIVPCIAQEYTRNFYMPLAAAAYSNDPNKCLSQIQRSFYGDNQNVYISLYRQYTVKCVSLNATCSGYTAVDTHDRNVYLAFKGTENYEEFYENVWNYDEMVPILIGGKVCKQFFDAFNVIWNAGMKDDIYYLKNRYQGYGFIISGYSTGGAMASIAAATLDSTGIFKNPGLITFGQPRTGDKDYTDAINAAMVSEYDYPSRVVNNDFNNRDIIAQLPPLNDTVYHHHMLEMWYPGDMGCGAEWIDCHNGGGEDPSCSDSLNDTLLTYEDHKYYFGRDFAQFGINYCPNMINCFG